MIQSHLKYEPLYQSSAAVDDGYWVSKPINIGLNDGFPLPNIYLIVTLPNISYVVHHVSLFMYTPQSIHYVMSVHVCSTINLLSCCLRIRQYLNGTIFLSWELTLILTGQKTSLIYDPQIYNASSLAPLWSLDEAIKTL